MMPMRRIPIIVRLWTRRRARTQDSARAVGFGLSIALHALIALTLIFFGRENIHPPVVMSEIIADLVQEEIPAIEPAAGETTARPSESPRPQIPVKGRPSAAATETARPNLGALLAMVERAHRPETIRSQPEHEAADVVAAIGGGEDDVVRGSLGNTALKDFIRAQIERRWQVDVRRLGGRHMVVSLRLVLGADGDVERAEIVEDPARKDDPLYRLVTVAGRDAALLSSPLQLPPGISGDKLDFTLDLNTKDAMR